jgi:ABC-type Zn uptake system ZnuABC Zn-binding protein ZnuA
VIPNDDGSIVLADEYKKNFEANIEKMLAQAEDIKEEMRSTIAQA